MSSILRSAPRLLAAALAVSALLLPIAAPAQDAPSYATAQQQDQQIRGRIQSIDGTFNLTVQDDGGYLDAIQLRQGTIINPTGLTLAPGMVVTIMGYPSGSVFNAVQIDTPYTYDGPAPTPSYYGPGFWYPGYAYGYGPSFSLGFVIGYGGGYSLYRQPWTGHWYSGGYGYHGGGYGYHGGYGYNGGGYHNGNGNNGGNGYHGGNGGTPPQNGGGTPPQNGYHGPTQGGGSSSGYGYRAPSNGTSGNGNYRMPSGGYRAPSSGGYAAPSGGYRAPSGGGYHAAPSGGGGGYHAAPSGGGGGHAAPSGGGGHH